MLYVILAGPILLGYLTLSRGRAFYYLVNLFVVNYITGLGKLWYHQARPFWLTTDIQALHQCSNDFGSPSGHSSYTMHMTLMLVLDIFASSADALSGDSAKQLKSQILGALTAVLSLALPLVVGFSRLYLG
jgi:membrane-associated phospholipid phosphatase